MFFWCSSWFKVQPLFNSWQRLSKQLLTSPTRNLWRSANTSPLVSITSISVFRLPATVFLGSLVVCVGYQNLCPPFGTSSLRGKQVHTLSTVKDDCLKFLFWDLLKHYSNSSMGSLMGMKFTRHEMSVIIDVNPGVWTIDGNHPMLLKSRCRQGAAINDIV